MPCESGARGSRLSIRGCWVRGAVRVEGDRLLIGAEQHDLRHVLTHHRRRGRQGGGRHGRRLGRAPGPDLRAKQVTGWINVPADCVQPLSAIHLHAARAGGPERAHARGAAGADEILRLVSAAGPDDLCIALISGGASALMPAPVPGISLADKLAVTRHLSAAGADIRQLNTVRKQLSRIKGGGLRRPAGPGTLRLW